MSVWQLERAINEYKTLHFANGVAGNEEGTPDLWGSFYGDKPLSTIWTPPRVAYLESEEPEGDFPYFWGAACPVFTSGALNALREVIAPYGEFLPLISSDGEFTAFKVLHFIDAIDIERSEIKWYPQVKRQLGQPKHVEKIKRFEFHEEKLQGAVIFRIPQLPLHEVFVTDVFANRVREADLKGFSFKQVWPQPEPVISARVARALESRRKRQSRSDSRE